MAAICSTAPFGPVEIERFLRRYQSGNRLLSRAFFQNVRNFPDVIYCGNREHHEYELYLDQENIDHTKTKAKSPQTNGICERFHKTILSEFYQIAFREKIYESIEMLQNDLDEWLREYNESCPHSGKYCYGKTPMQTFLDSLSLSKEKMLQYSSNIPNKKEI